MHGGHNHGAGPWLVWRPGLEAAWKARRAYIERLHAQGLRHPGGRPRKPKVVLTMTQEAKAVLVEAGRELEAALPADILTRPIESLSPAQALGRAALSGTHQLVRIIEQPIAVRENAEDAPPKADELKLQRLVGDMSNVALKALRRNATTERASDGLAELLAEIRAEKAAKAAQAGDK
jgi:hypothetical protein